MTGRGKPKHARVMTVPRSGVTPTKHTLKERAFSVAVAHPNVKNVKGKFGPKPTKFEVTMSSPGIYRINCKNNTLTSITLDTNTLKADGTVETPVEPDSINTVTPAPCAFVVTNPRKNVYAVRLPGNLDFGLTLELWKL